MELRTLRYFVAVAEELHFGRAAARLHMSQPPLSRAIKQLETEFGAALFDRSSAGVGLTGAGSVLLDEARALLERADRVHARVAAAAGTATLTVGILGGGADPAAARLAGAFRGRHPRVEVRVRETGLTDPTCGLHAGLVDVALTRGPFDETGLAARELRADPVGALLRADDPLARGDRLNLADLADRRWFLFPQGTDGVWQTYWNGGAPREGPVVRAVQECRQAVLWNGTVGMTPLGHEPGRGLTVVPLVDMEPSRVLVAWRAGDANPLIRSFVRIATDAYRR
ncbi:LysR family transcriptional regulator [Streptomyces spectabilis]|uniref:DNA-binding transcriptional LysR family regulator n=1 Tax=Streptomyces spectabilis TaxID=68270 RepID=A0A5P2X4D9_STRST|nr:LysR substrate-binding domain-containing protein [Streptomyces spectabilis]MBB5101382.1 DNA-binding transcriptional LysR family regulator [Streptomyces spectabilis]MCI3900578.1 LysR substrate-binding domain-containing protein [Streptomyces spectabilis]QEV58139.1 LysR family transcriptional regulator [Streptomyces spectabilis]GGV11038.1 LysR family transcriptional regulator [Streptomyces spectabilis]